MPLVLTKVRQYILRDRRDCRILVAIFTSQYTGGIVVTFQHMLGGPEALSKGASTAMTDGTLQAHSSTRLYTDNVHSVVMQWE